MLGRFPFSTCAHLQQHHKLTALPAKYLIPVFSKPSPFTANQSAFNVKALYPPRAFPIKPDDFRVTVISGKKAVSKHAVYRRRASRRLKSAVEVIFPEQAPKGMDYIFYTNANIVNLPWQDLLQQVSKAAGIIQHKISKRKKTS
ncbi:predicted protein [Lichtheimia corymbifera JMRC:FSU:9682]|uniref:Uncharacterized protein n=1 Tax=Lichtheimia corymbifera JMRC:FSU:9682 TaxID=1263082 RepID=A0A068S592_9FUNG|nr:predicted protein [Lichtheimia corymbifera JMRC:FSU:9682]